jgi:hypothetical protein
MIVVRLADDISFLFFNGIESITELTIVMFCLCDAHTIVLSMGFSRFTIRC